MVNQNIQLMEMPSKQQSDDDRNLMGSLDCDSNEEEPALEKSARLCVSAKKVVSMHGNMMNSTAQHENDFMERVSCEESEGVYRRGTNNDILIDKTDVKELEYIRRINSLPQENIQSNEALDLNTDGAGGEAYIDNEPG